MEILPSNQAALYFTWELIQICNYRCRYCWFTIEGWEKFHGFNSFPGIERLTEAWTRMHEVYGKCHIMLVGGEPAVYPDFIPLVQMLTKMHSVELATNLTFDAVAFADQVNLKRVKIGASFHPEFADFDTFFKSACHIKEKGPDYFFITYVAHPLQLKKLPEYRAKFKAAGFDFQIQVLDGFFDGRIYPTGYTQEELDILLSVLDDDSPSTRNTKLRLKWRMEKGSPTGAPDSSRQHQPPAPGAQHPPKREPVLCQMGQKYAKIYPNGDAYRCCAYLKGSADKLATNLADANWPDALKNIYLGNFYLDPNFKMLEEPAWCDYTPCPCERCMIVGEETRWKPQWTAAV